MKNRIKKYMIIKNEDGAESKKLLQEVPCPSVPTIEENLKQYRRRKKIITMLVLLSYVVIITVLMHLCFEF